MKIQFSTAGALLVVTLDGRLTAYQSLEFQNLVWERVATSSLRRVLVDLQLVTQLDRYGAEALVKTACLVRSKGGFLRLFNGRPALYAALDAVPGHEACERFNSFIDAQRSEPATSPAPADAATASEPAVSVLDFRSSEGPALLLNADVNLKSCTTYTFEQPCKTGSLTSSGVAALWCAAGKIRLHRDENEFVDLSAHEVIVLYGKTPFVYEALEAGSELDVLVCAGADDEDVFNSLGFFNGLIASVRFPAQEIKDLQQILSNAEATGQAPDRTNVLHRVWKLAMGIRSEARERGDTQFLEAVQIINQNFLQRTVQLEPVWRQMKMSRSHFNVVFARNGFKSPGSYVADLQLRKARRLLRQRDLAISDIAFRCGFSGGTHFSTFYKRHTGHAPIAERRGVTRVAFQ